MKVFIEPLGDDMPLKSITEILKSIKKSYNHFRYLFIVYLEVGWLVGWLDFL